MPEVLFNPSDIGINQAGLAEMMAQTIEKCPTALELPLYENVVLAGGNTKFGGFPERLEKEMMMVKPVEAELRIF